MTILEMSTKYNTADGRMKVTPLTSVVSGGSADDFIVDGTIAIIIEESKKGYYDERYSKNAVSVIMAKGELQADGTVKNLGEAVIVPLSVFDRVAGEYELNADGKAERTNRELVLATGTAVDTWKRAANAARFIEQNMGKAIKFELIANVKVRAWDRAAGKASDSELRDQKVYKSNWVE